MAKLHRGRFGGAWGMYTFTAVKLYALADEYEAMINDPENKDDHR